MTTVDGPGVSLLVVPAKTWPPPGRGLMLASGLVAIVIVEAASRFAFGLFFIGGMAGMAVGLIWLIRLVQTLVQRRLRLGPREWLRWLIVPVLLVGAWATFLMSIPFTLRLAASRGGMDDAALALVADEDLEYGWIGWFPVERIDRTDAGVRFLIADSGFLDLIGFAYATDGPPPIIGEDIYEHLDGNWWHWRESW